ncbi:unnamed protein product [Bursaphelenchus xylophilus]|uniref:(pine wood nematode) hypothetical protein n=1 Tax=Bursaphelenchus xylophilus TaxID=6326 RepID=A0A1I7SEL8_BURXY|nr:unnamed protein product [Bursaphelenchus xylophilus]CAG9113631.1 unnamed protein product [Bursaphelenchus xylophilus]
MRWAGGEFRRFLKHLNQNNRPRIYLFFLLLLKLYYLCYFFTRTYNEDPSLFQIINSTKDVDISILMMHKIDREDFNVKKKAVVRRRAKRSVIMPKNFTQIFDRFDGLIKDDIGR